LIRDLTLADFEANSQMMTFTGMLSMRHAQFRIRNAACHSSVRHFKPFRAQPFVCQSVALSVR
jgi:hypothetical protein